MPPPSKQDPAQVSAPGSLPHHERALAALAKRGRLRRLSPRLGVDFTSNDYLGLAALPDLAAAASAAIARGVPLGAGGSRLLRGNHEEHEALEAEAAQFFGAGSALYFGSGFAANAALMATLPAHGDLIVHDALVHASAWEGMSQTKATCLSARHNDPQAFEDAIAGWRKGGGTGCVWIAVESLYSMDGDIAPLAALAEIAGRFDAMLLIDEAHATGVLGPGGRGLGACLEGRENVVALHTCGKALGASGALITCSASIRQFLINRARAFIYATAPSPVMAAVVRRSLEIVRDQPERRAKLAERVAFAGRQLGERCGLAPSGTHIMPVTVGSDARAVGMAEAMQHAGYDIRAIRPPTVPEGTARLRLTLTLNTDEATIAAMIETLSEALREGDGTIASPRYYGETAKTTEREASLLSSRSDAPHRQVRGSSGPEPLATPHTHRAAAPPPDLLPVRTGRRPSFIITGTGTGVGKTVFAAALVQALDGEYWKPVQAGLDGATDTETAQRLSGLPRDRFHPEAYRLRTPASPHTAALIDGVTIDTDALVPPQANRPLVTEGAGGLMVPLTPRFLMIDLFQRWNLPVILVSSTALGTINHTLLSIEALRARGIPIHGVAFAGDENAATQDTITNLGRVRALGRLPLLAQLTPASLCAAFSANFNLADFVPDSRRAIA